MEPKPTMTTRIPQGSDAYVHLMDAVARQIPVGTALALINEALIAAGLTAESLSNESMPSIVHALLPKLARACRANGLHEIVLDLSSLGYALAPTPSPAQRAG